MNTLDLQLTCTCKFHLGDEPDAWQAWYDDSSWSEVTLPHDWSVALPFSKDYSSGTGYLAGGIGWYRLHIKPDPEWKDREISICFDGIYKNSRVWCNSYYLGERPNGYISFSYDITKQFRFDSENIISIFVDRREIADSRWFTGSGITRKVTLKIEEKIHPVFQGLTFETKTCSEKEASVFIRHELINKYPDTKEIQVIDKLFDEKQNLVCTLACKADISSEQVIEVTNEGTIANPTLWSPESPHLYTLQTFFAQEGMEPYLVSTTKTGIRSFFFDADKGFFLNHKPYLFQGVCLHHDAGCLGAAVTPAVWYRRLQKLKNMGCNAIRMSHNPHMPELYDLCDSMGFFVMDEAFDEWEAPKNKWSTGHNVYPPKHQGYYADFPAWHKQDLTDLIRRDRNHPSIIMWSIGNEIDYPNDPYCHPSFETMTGNNDANKPAAERMYNPSRPDATRLSDLSAMLCNLVKESDTTRPVTLAAAFPELSAKIGFIDSLDVVGFNYKEHLYEETHKAFPDKPILGSENGHGIAQWEAVTQSPYISGQFLWTGIDYLGEAHGWPIHGSSAGLMTLAGYEKTGYYRRQSFWSQKPMIHLATVRETESTTTQWGQTFDDALACEYAPVDELWNYLPGESVVVKCYTNMPKAEIFVNNKSKGIFEKAKHADCILTTIPFEEGEIKAVAFDLEDHMVANHTLYTTQNACQMKVKKIKIPVTELPFYAKCEQPNPFHDLVQYEVTLLDAHGKRVYSDETLLTVCIENGKLLGIENGNLADLTDYSANYRRAYRGQLLIYALPSKDMKMTITGHGIQPKTIEE